MRRLCFGIVFHLLCALVTETGGSGSLITGRRRIITNEKVSYEVVRKIGAGVSGEVFLVEDVAREVQYAMKIMKQEDFIRYEARLLLYNERGLHIRMSHPNIVRMIDAFDSPDEIYLVTEYCNGGDLYEKFKASGGVSEDYAKRIIHQVSQGLKYLHDQHIIHRDIKPENIFLTRFGEAKIGDFGFATQLRNPMARKIRGCGSSGFKAPEILFKKPYSKGVDIWALGVTLYAIIYDGMPITHVLGPEYTRYINAGDNVYIPRTPSISNQLKNLLNRMLEPREDIRITIDEVLAHPWFASLVDVFAHESTTNGIAG